MIGKSNITFQIALLILSAFFLNRNTYAQAFGELLPGSSELLYDEDKGIYKLLDGANFVYKGNKMYCDSAYYFKQNETIHAYGHVQVQKSNEVNLYCDSLHYFTKTAIANLWGNVRATNEQYRLTTNSMIYNTKTDVGTYYEGGKIVNQLKNEVLTSRVGYFQPNSKDFFFRDSVKYHSDKIHLTTDSLQFNYSKQKCYFFGETQIQTDESTMKAQKGWYQVETGVGSLVQDAVIYQGAKVIRGDTLFYDPNERVAEGYSNVFVKDTSELVAFKGDYALMNDSLRFSMLTGNALLIKYHQKDTIYIHADTLYNRNDSLDNREFTIGYHNVRIFSHNLQGKGDSLSYTKTDGYMELYCDPILWSKNGELKGDSMRVFMNDSIIDKAHIWGKTTAIMEVDSGRYYNQVGGSEMIAYFDSNEVKMTKVIGNAQTIYFPEETNKVYQLLTDSILLAEAVLNSGTSLLDSIHVDSLIIDSLADDSLFVFQNLISDSLLHAQVDSIAIVNSDTLYYQLITQIKRMGMNRFYASEIKIYFDSGEVVGVTYYTKPDGVFYPMDRINKEEQFVQHFKTNFAIRPKSVEDILKD